MLPGSIADHLTSFAAHFGTSGQTKCTEFIRHGAAGTSGTVADVYLRPAPLGAGIDGLKDRAAANRIADQLAALRVELRGNTTRAAKRTRTIARKVVAALEHIPTELDHARARKALRRPRGKKR